VVSRYANSGFEIKTEKNFEKSLDFLFKIMYSNIVE
jgi:hypothetical protein